MRHVRIESTRTSMVVLPPVGFSDVDRKPGSKTHESCRIMPAEDKDKTMMTIVPGDYWDAIKDRRDVQSLFQKQENVVGFLRLVPEGDPGNELDASSPVILPSDDGEALITISACEDLDRLMNWAATNPNRTPVLAALSRRIAIVESQQKRGTTPPATGDVRQEVAQSE